MNFVMETFMTVEELADKIRLSKVYVYKMVRRKEIPFYHTGRKIIFSPSEIEQWLTERFQK